MTPVRFGRALVTALVGTALALPASAQDALKVAPQLTKLLFENDRVRVYDNYMKPGEAMGMHSHPDHLVYVLSDGKMQLTSPDGRSNDVDVKVGQVVWVPAVTHSTRNIGTKDLYTVIVELKQAH